ncbi:TRAP transporter small permease subunit [Actibacterium lipolyticum]|uniref:TRAP transporter small permease protein n=1 Tax=Actibacterium lipolyticum TaxID=1524263 RepID=A0A238JKL7_9RHOB|nr:TRAP transporter small permease subunit [Actibacterium lipolyticum]SMX31035.1 Tripartite ATP-independent periplasmic transporters, DctQ component [Actibacterium lipolyticum]
MKLGERVIAGLALALLVLMSAIVVQVVCSAFDVNPIASFASDLAVVGQAITLNSLLDLQWHLLVIAGLLPAGIVWLQDSHVRVDFIYQGRADVTRARINLAGNLIFAAPFLALALPASWDFTQRAWTSDEGSRHGGLNDLWLIKAVLPLGLAFLAGAIAIETFRLFRAAR